MPDKATIAQETRHQQGERAPEAALYWDIRDIQFHCRMGRSTAWRLVREDGFPPPVLCGKRSVLWPQREVVGFLEERRDAGHYRRARAVPTAQPVQFAARPVRSRAARRTAST